MTSTAWFDQIQDPIQNDALNIMNRRLYPAPGAVTCRLEISTEGGIEGTCWP